MRLCEHLSCPSAALTLSYSEDVHGSTPLHYAAQEGHSGVVSLLLSTGRLQDTKDSAGRTALMLGALSGSEETVKLLLNNGVS